VAKEDCFEIFSAKFSAKIVEKILVEKGSTTFTEKNNFKNFLFNRYSQTFLQTSYDRS
jgi:hypothetical protein